MEEGKERIGSGKNGLLEGGVKVRRKEGKFMQM